MDNGSNTKDGIKLLIQKCREQFRISENLNYYSEEEYKEAERRYIKFCLSGSPK